MKVNDNVGTTIRMNRKILTIILSLASTTLFAYSNENRVILDWSTGIVRAQTTYSAKYDDSGIPIDYATTDAGPARERNLAYERARTEAVEQISFALRGIEVEPGLFVKDLLESDPSFARKFGDLLADRIRSRETPRTYFAARSDARFVLYDLIRALPYEYPENPFPRADKNPLATEYTSLIIDVRDEDVSPMIFPSVYDEDGLEIYGRQFVNIAAACKKGMVSYCFNEQEAKAHPKAGEHPYFATALRSNKHLPVIAHRDARKILSHKKTVENLKQCHVIFIIRKVSGAGKTQAHERSLENTQPAR
ncbi:MAG TPA: hypothetical protein VF857_06730 [Spirochaetota bacterium]